VSTLTNDLTFQLSDTGVILNDDTIIGVPFVDITGVTGLDSAPYRQTKRDHEGVDGGFMDAEFETGRDIVLSGTVYGNNQPLETYLDSLKANFAPSTVLVPFYFYSSTVGLRVLYVKPLGCSYDWDVARRTGMVDIQFSMYAEDPRIYSTPLITVLLIVGAMVYTGFGFNFGFPFGFSGTSSTSDGQYINNAGNRPTPPIFTITGPVVNPIIYNDTTGSYMAFNITLLSNQTLVIDTQYHTVRLNGITNSRNVMTTASWPHLQAGNNFIRFRATSGSGSLTVQYRSAWR
jgi:hypothetical protein